MAAEGLLKAMALANKAIELGAAPAEVQSLLPVSLQGAFEPEYSTPDYSQTIPAGQEFDDPIKQGLVGKAGNWLQENWNPATGFGEDFLDFNSGSPAAPNIGLPPFRSDTDILSGPTQALSDLFSRGAEASNAQGGLPPQRTQEGSFLGNVQEGIVGKATDIMANVSGLRNQEDMLLDDDPLNPAVATNHPTFLARQAQLMQEQGVPTPKTDALPDDATAAQVKTALNADKAEAGREVIKATGGSKEALSGWDAFADKVDLMTFGLSMMNLTDGQGSLTSKVARSMQAGIDAKTAQGDKASATAAAGRAEARAERKVRVEEGTLGTKQLDSRTKAIEAMANLQGDNDISVAAMSGMLSMNPVYQKTAETQGWNADQIKKHGEAAADNYKTLKKFYSTQGQSPPEEQIRRKAMEGFFKQLGVQETNNAIFADKLEPIN